MYREWDDDLSIPLDLIRTGQLRFEKFLGY